MRPMKIRSYRRRVLRDGAERLYFQAVGEPLGESPLSPLPFFYEKTKVQAFRLGLFGRGGRTRTHDPWFWRPVLYQTELHPYTQKLLYQIFFNLSICFVKKTKKLCKKTKNLCFFSFNTSFLAKSPSREIFEQRFSFGSEGVDCLRRARKRG